MLTVFHEKDFYRPAFVWYYQKSTLLILYPTPTDFYSGDNERNKVINSGELFGFSFGSCDILLSKIKVVTFLTKIQKSEGNYTTLKN